MQLTCITTVFNEGANLRHSIESVLNQTYKDLQYIVVDDGADTPTKTALSKIKDSRIQLITQDNKGLSAARNAALAQTDGEYVCFLDADDVRPNWAFQAMVDLVRRDDPDLVFCRGTVSNERGQLLPFYDTPRFEEIRAMTTNRPISHAHRARATSVLLEPQSANKLVRTSLIRDHGLHFPEPYFFEDMYFHVQALIHARRVSFLHTPCFCYFRRYDTTRITASAGQKRFDVLPVTSLTLGEFARSRFFDDPDYRDAALAGCFRLVAWCHDGIAPELDAEFRTRASAMIRALDPRYLEAAQTDAAAFPELRAARTYIRDLCPDVSA